MDGQPECLYCGKKRGKKQTLYIKILFAVSNLVWRNLLLLKSEDFFYSYFLHIYTKLVISMEL